MTFEEWYDSESAKDDKEDFLRFNAPLTLAEAAWNAATVAERARLLAPQPCGHPLACCHEHINSCFTRGVETPSYMHCPLVAGCRWCRSLDAARELAELVREKCGNTHTWAFADCKDPMCVKAREILAEGK